MKIILLIAGSAICLIVAYRLILLPLFRKKIKPNEHDIFVTLLSCSLLVKERPFLEEDFLNQHLGLDLFFHEEVNAICLAALFEVYLFSLQVFFGDLKLNRLAVTVMRKSFPDACEWLTKLSAKFSADHPAGFSTKAELITYLSEWIAEHLMGMPLEQGRIEAYSPEKVANIANIVARRLHESMI